MTDIQINFHPSAVEEAEGARDWYAERSPAAAKAFLHDLDHALKLVSEAPERWPQFEHGTRRVLLRRFPFSLVYRVEGSSVQVVALMHQRRKPGHWHRRG